MTVKVEKATNLNMQCWDCGELGHSKKTCFYKSPAESKNNGQSIIDRNQGGAAGKDQQTKAQDHDKVANAPPQCTHSTYRWVGHTKA